MLLCIKMCVVKRLLMLSHAKRLASRFFFSGLAEKNIVFIYINILSPTLSLLKIALLPFKIIGSKLKGRLIS